METIETRKTFVEVEFPGSFLSETSVYEVEERDPVKVATKYPRCFALRFYEQISKQVEVGGELKTVYGSRLKPSKTYFPDGEVMTLADVKRKVPDSRILVSNMEGNGWYKVVKTRRGNFQPFTEKDEVVKTKPARKRR